MTTHSEEILQVVNHVKHKKADGSIYVMPERVAWMPDGKQKIALSIKYFDIKTQKISPEGKPKIQLQLVLHSGDSPTFHFVNPGGPGAQLKDRNDVKELLQQLLPQFKRKLAKDMEEKQKILLENPGIYQLYRDLVGSNVITAEEFWSQVVPSKLRSDGSLINPSFTKSVTDLISRVTNDPSGNSSKQLIGISPAFLTGLETSDGCNGTKYNLTNEIIEAIFRTYPAVKRKHYDTVPHKISEGEFWKKFFESHYYHRDQNSDFFADCAKSDEIRIKEASQTKVDNPFVDLTKFDDVPDAIVSRADEPLESNDTTKKSQSSSQKTVNTNQTLIHRFNQHSIMVLDACLTSSGQKASIDVSKESSDHETDADDEKKKRMKRLLDEKTSFDDLKGQDVTLDWITVSCKPLEISDRDRYMAGPTPLNPGADVSMSHLTNSSSNRDKRMTTGDLVQIREETLSKWLPELTSCLNSPSALSALSDLSPGGSFMKSSHDRMAQLKESIPSDVQKELKSLYTAANELLKHFWSCFPVTNDQLEERLSNMKMALEKFQSTKIQPFNQFLINNHYDPQVCIY